MAAGYRKCPDCGQDVLKTANECKNCGYSFVGGGEHAPSGDERKFAKVELYIHGFRMKGAIVLGGAGFDFRLSDFLNTKASRFFPLLDAEVIALNGTDKPRHQDVVMINKESVNMLIPLEEPERDKKRLEGIVSSTTHRW